MLGRTWDREQLGKLAITIGPEYLRDDDLVPRKPVRLFGLGFQVSRVLDQSLERLQRFPVVNVGDKAVPWVLPGLFSQVARCGSGSNGDLFIQAMELVVELALGEDEGR